ncbi:MAG: murein hydrolase activator EnvC family protein [Bacteroidota bacterium]
MRAAFILLVFCFISTSTTAFTKKHARTKNHIVTKKKSGRKSTVLSKTKYSVQHSKTKLQTLHQEIAKAQQKVYRLNAKEQSTISTLQETQKKKVIISQKVGKLAGEVSKIQDTLTVIQRTESSLKEKLLATKTEYANLAKIYVNLSKQHVSGAQSSNDLLPGSTGPSSGILQRLPSYMQLLHKKLTTYLTEISKVQGALSYQQAQLSQYSSLQEKILKEKEKEQQFLQKTMNAQKLTLSQVRLDKALVLKELEKKQKSAQQIAGMISSLVHQESKKQDEHVKNKNIELRKDLSIHEKGEKKSISEKVSKSIAQKEIIKNDIHESDIQFSGIFKWPTNARKILRSFGQYRNSVTNTIMDNPGLDIACSEGSSAFCSASGKVSLVHWLPGYNSMVIVDHGNSYRSVYANLSNSLVKKGQIISAGSVIGKTTQSVDGEFLHFELWKGKNRLNPLSYCR